MRTEQGEKKAKEIRAAYNRENMRTLAANVRKETAEKFKAVAEKNGLTAGGMLKDYIELVCATEDVSVSLGAPTKGVTPTMVRLSARNFDRLYHETSFHNPNHLNPDEMLNEILKTYFQLADKLRAEN